MTNIIPDSEKLLFDYFLNELDHWKRKDIKTSVDLIEHYKNYITIKENEDNCSCCGGGRDIIDEQTFNI